MKRVGAVFTGQGSQYVGMGKALCTNFTCARNTFLTANEILNFDLMKLCFEGDEKKLSMTEYSQPAIVTYSIALYRVFEERFGYRPVIFAGHSLGEYSALTCAEAIMFEDTLRIVQKRGKLMGSLANDGKMAAIIGAESDDIREYCIQHSMPDRVLSISNYNTKQQTVISGNDTLVKEATEYFSEKGFRTKILNVSGAFHSQMMSEITEQFSEELEKYTLSTPKYKVISNVDGMPFIDSRDIKVKLVRQLVNPVKWSNVMDYFLRDQIDTVIEFGAGRTLGNFFKTVSKTIQTFSYEQNEDFTALTQIAKSSDFTFAQFKDLASRCISIIACTKNNNFDENQYQKNVVEVCQKIRSINVCNEGGKNITAENVMEWTITALRGKLVPNDEIAVRLLELERKTPAIALQKIINKYANEFFERVII